MNSAKVLQVIDVLNVGGAEKVFVDLTNLLYENDISVSAMFLLNGGVLRKELNPNIEIIEIGRKKRFSFESFQKTAEVLSQFQIIHCHSRHNYRYIKLVQKLFSIKTKVILHDHYGLIKINKSVPFLFGGLFKPSYCIGVSQELNNWASAELKISNEKIFLLENIVRKQEIEATEKNTKSGIVLVSNIKPNKNQSFILEILDKVKTSLTFIGKNQDEAYYSELKEKSKEFENVSFLTNIDNIQPELEFYELGLHTSKSETGPLVLIEYLSQGLPFLAYETGEVAQILKPHFPQYFIDNFDRNMWAERVNILLQEKPDKEKMEKIFDRYFGSRQYVEKCLKIYTDINS